MHWSFWAAVDDGEVLARLRGFPAPGGPVDLDVRRGEVVRVTGPNGCGKTSLLRALAGLAAPVQPARAAAAPAALVLQDAMDGLVGLTVAGEARLRGVALPGSLGGLAHRDVATLSSGEARTVALEVAAASGRPLLLLDEPTEGLDDAHLHGLDAMIGAHRDRGAVVVADHGELLQDVADRTVALGASSSHPPPPIAPPGRDVLLHFGATRVRRGEAQVALPNVDLPTGLHAVVGRNGAGKSTLLRTLAGLEEGAPDPRAGPSGGPAVQVDGRPARTGHDVRLLLPHAWQAFWRPSVAEELAGCDPTVVDALVPAELRDRHPLTLSGGEAQRVALAKVLGRTAQVYLLDEPEAHLDGPGRHALLRLLGDRARGACILVATHDRTFIDAASTRTSMEATA